MAMNINDPQSRMEIDALANEIKAIANSMYLELANSESNPSHIQVQFTPQNPLQPTYSESIPVRYTTSYEPSISIDTNNIQSATHPLTSTNEYTNLQSYQTKNYNISSNPEPYYKTPDNSKLPPYNSTTSPYQQGGVVSELNQLNSKMDEFLQRRSISPSKNQTPKTNEYSFQQHQNLYSPKTKEFQTNLTVNTNFEKLKSSPKWDQSESLTSTARNAQATPISDLQDKNVAISFVQEKRTNWTPSPTPLDHHIIPKINTADEHKMITTPSYNLQALVSPTSASKKQNYDKTKLDHILQNITKRNYTSTSPPATLLASPTHSLSNSKSVQDIFLVSSNLNPMQTDPQNLVSFAAHKTNSSILKNPPVGHSPQTTPTDVISQIGRDFAKLKVEPTQTNLNDTLTPTPFRVNTAELSKKSASPSIDSYGHRRIKSGIDQLQFPYMTPQPIKGTSYPYPSTQSQGYLPTDLRYSTESRGLHERNKSLHSFQSFTPKEYNSGMGNVSTSISQAQMQQLQRLQESEEKLDQILGKSQSNKNVKFLRKLPDTTEEQPFTSAHPTETIKRSTYRSISPTKSYGERGTVKQEISFKKLESLKPSATASEKKRFMNKTEPVVI